MGKFVIYRKNTGYDFHLKAANGETIGTSEIYTKKDACVDGIESVIRCAEAAEIEDQAASPPGKSMKIWHRRIRNLRFIRIRRGDTASGSLKRADR